MEITNSTLQTYMNSDYFIVGDPVRIDNIVHNAILANKLTYRKDSLEVTFITRQGKKKDVVTYALPINSLTGAHLNLLLSYKNKH